MNSTIHTPESRWRSSGAVSPVRLVTIGVYQSTEEAFFAALERAKVDTFCDIRYRRSVRGRDYAFVNSTRLQERLQQCGIRYLHRRQLAPRPELRACQAKADAASGTSQRQRVLLDKAFIAGYRAENLASFDSRKFVNELGGQMVALFCVEREPAACHRSLLAERLHRDLGIPVEHLFP